MLAKTHAKACTKCGVSKPMSAFKPRSRARDGRTSHCYSCRRKYPSKARWDGSPKGRAYSLAYGRRVRGVTEASLARLETLRKLPDNKMVVWLKKVRNAKNHSKRAKAGKLTAAWVERWANATACPITGLGFVMTGETVNGSPHPLSPSADRLDTTVGYTDDNTRVISYFANVAKNAWPEDQFRLLVMAAASNMRH